MSKTDVSVAGEWEVESARYVEISRDSDLCVDLVSEYEVDEDGTVHEDPDVRRVEWIGRAPFYFDHPTMGWLVLRDDEGDGWEYLHHMPRV